MWKEAGDLHTGEAEALVLARQHKTGWFLTDDSTPRLFCLPPGHGSAWIPGRYPVECRPQASVAGRNGRGAKRSGSFIALAFRQDL